MFNEALFTIAKIWKQHKCPSINKWIKRWYMHICIHSAIKRNEILPFKTTWIDLEGIILSDISQQRQANII